jgi:hypothetical protein
MSQSPTNINPNVETEHTFAKSHSFFQEQAKQYKIEKELLEQQLKQLRANALENQKVYDDVYRIFNRLLHTETFNKNEEKNNLLFFSQRLNTFVEEFNTLFQINKSRIIYLNYTSSQIRANQFTTSFTHQSFWDERMQDLFDEENISFAPIDSTISQKIFAHPSLRSAGMIPFITSLKQKKPRTNRHIKSFLVFGSKDAKLFLPDSQAHFDLLTRIKNILSSL